MKRLLALALTLVMACSILPMGASAYGHHPFTDVSDDDWFADGVQYVYQNNLMNGTSATKLSPKNPCTVEQSILLVLRVYNL